MGDERITIYLADLTHTGQLIATNIHPLAIGLVASYAKKKFGDNIDVRLFRNVTLPGEAILAESSIPNNELNIQS